MGRSCHFEAQLTFARLTEAAAAAAASFASGSDSLQVEQFLSNFSVLYFSMCSMCVHNNTNNNINNLLFLSLFFSLSLTFCLSLSLTFCLTESLVFIFSIWLKSFSVDFKRCFSRFFLPTFSELPLAPPSGDLEPFFASAFSNERRPIQL